MHAPTLTDLDVSSIQTMLDEDGYAVARRHDGAEPAELERFVARFGELVFTPGERPLPGTDNVFEVSNVGRSERPRSVWHTDTSYVAAPPKFTVLAAVAVPESGGATLVLDQRHAARTADPGLLHALAGVELLHVPSRDSRPDEAGSGAWHPALRVVGGQESVALYVGARERLAGARRAGVPLDRCEATELIDAACSHATSEPGVRHRWSPGDVLFIDNRTTLHAADHDGVVGDRILHRVMCGAERPVPMIRTPID